MFPFPLQGGQFSQMIAATEKFELQPDPANLSDLRRFVRRQAALRGLTEEEQFHAALVSTEAVSNAIRHTDGSGGRPHTIEVLCSGDEGDLVIEVRNSGRFRPHGGDVEREGGRGLILIAGLTKSFDLSAGQAGTSVRMHLAAGTHQAA